MKNPIIGKIFTSTKKNCIAITFCFTVCVCVCVCVRVYVCFSLHSKWINYFITIYHQVIKNCNSIIFFCFQFSFFVIIHSHSHNVMTFNLHVKQWRAKKYNFFAFHWNLKLRFFQLITCSDRHFYCINRNKRYDWVQYFI